MKNQITVRTKIKVKTYFTSVHNSVHFIKSQNEFALPHANTNQGKIFDSYAEGLFVGYSDC